MIEDRIRALHYATYASAAEETWKTYPICGEDGHTYPCATVQALDLSETETRVEWRVAGNTPLTIPPGPRTKASLKETGVPLEKRTVRVEVIEDWTEEV